MPQVPYQPYPTQQSREAPTPLYRLNVPADAFGENIGRAISGLGAKMGQVGDELWGRAVAMQELRNETEKTQAVSDLETQSAQLRADYFNTMGNNAVNGYQGFIDKQNQLRTDIRNKMSNPAAQRMFDSVSLGVVNRAMIAAASHSASELRRANQQADATTMDVAAQNAGYAANDDEFNMNLKQIEAAAQRRAADQGWDEATTNDVAFKAQSKAYVNRITQIGKTNPALAKQMMTDAFANNKIHTSDMDRLENGVNGELNNTGSRVIARQTLEEPNDPERVFRSWFPNANVRGFNPDFATRFYTLARTYELETGNTLGVINSLKSAGVRTTAEQQEIYNRSIAEGFLAARPGTGRHEDTRGEAIDISRGDFLDWAHKNAQRFGLEFLPGWRPGETSTAFARDPVHIQLARGTDGTAPSRFQIPEKFFVDRARRQAEAVAPDNAQFIDSVIGRTMTDFRQGRAETYNQNLINRQTIENEILTRRPNSVDELLSISPDARQAYDSLNDPRMQMQIEQKIRSLNNIPDPEQIDNFRRLNAMSYQYDHVTDFLNTDLSDPSLKLTVPQRDRLMQRQNVINKKGYEDDPRFTHMMTIIRPYIPLTVQKNPADFNVFKGAMMEAVEQWERMPANKGKYPTSDELRTMTRQIVNPVPPSLQPYYGIEPPSGIGSWIWRHTLGSSDEESLLDRSQSIPQMDQDKIKDEFAKRGIPYSDEDVRRAWIGQQLEVLQGATHSLRPPFKGASPGGAPAAPSRTPGFSAPSRVAPVTPGPSPYAPAPPRSP